MGNQIRSLPALKFAPQWDIAFSRIQQVKTIGQLSAGEQKSVELIMGKWMVWFHWVVKKKWMRSHRIPLSPRYAKLYEPYADVLYHILEMCIQCHAVGLGSEYVHAGEWFSNICLEAMDAEMFGVVSTNREHCDPVPKSTVLSLIHSQVDEMVEGFNPILLMDRPNYSRLIDAALQMQLNVENFESDFWQPFLRAQRKYERSLKSTFQEQVHFSGKRETNSTLNGSYVHERRSCFSRQGEINQVPLEAHFNRYFLTER